MAICSSLSAYSTMPRFTVITPLGPALAFRVRLLLMTMCQVQFPVFISWHNCVAAGRMRSTAALIELLVSSSEAA